MKLKYITALFAGMVLMLSSCTDDFKKFNTDETGFPDDKQVIDYNSMGIAMKVVQQGIYFNYDWGEGPNWPWQTYQNLNADMYAGYFAPNTEFGQGQNSNIYYNFNDGWCSKGWEYTFGYIMPQVKRAEELTITDYPQFYAMTKILKVELMHRITDMYGPIIYTDFGKITGSKPESQKDVYYSFFEDLDEAYSRLIAHIDQNPDEKVKFDYILSAKSYTQWVKFCNSLRLRLAVRIYMADPTKATSEIQKALTAKYGLFEKADDIAQMVCTSESAYQNPLATISGGWGNAFMGANMQSILSGYNDPRIEKYFLPTTKKGFPTYAGVRLGINLSSIYKYDVFSRAYAVSTSPAILMTPAEVWLLRAEVALRGLSSENAETCYNNGVKASFDQWGCANADTYLQSTNVPAAYVDPENAENNIAATSTTTPKWGGTPEQMLEKIITQKWIAAYPEGCEAWAEFRRTGYPKLLPIKINNSNGIIPIGETPNRLPFPISIHSNELYDQVKALLEKGTDNAFTPLWWDTGRNF